MQLKPILRSEEGAPSLIEAARTFAKEQVAPHAEDWEIRRVMAEATLRRAIAEGYGALLVPVEHGGHGATVTTATEVLEAVAAGDLAFAFSLVVHNNLVASLAKNGTPAQRARFLQPMLSGEQIGAFCLTEPIAGTDAAAIATRAQRNGTGWVLDGAKAWVTNAVAAELFCVYAQTDPTAGSAGIAAFLVERGAPGLRVEPAYTMLGNHAMGASGLALQGVEVGDEMLFLPPGRGFKGAMAGIDLARVLLSGMCCGILGHALDVALDYTAGRRAFGQSVLDFQGMQWKFAEVATNLEAARLLTFRAAELLDHGAPASVPAAHAKKFATRAAMSGVSDCMQAMGGVGLHSKWPFARHLAAAKMAEYLDGTTEVQNIVIARSLMRRVRSQG